MQPGQRRRSYIRPKRPRRLDRLTREVLGNDFDGAGPRLETRDGHDQARLDWCRTQPCVVPATVLAGIEIEPGVEYFAPRDLRCWGPIDPCHEGEKRGRNLKSPDALAFSMCRNHHTQFTGGWGGKTVAITGADDSTDMATLVAWSKRFPFVEWGILVSATQEGSARFPSRPWIKEFSEAAHHNGLKVSAHLCGRWVRQLLIGELDWRAVPMVVLAAQRIQINTHAVVHAISPALFATLDLLHGRQVIFQDDGVNANHAPNLIGAGIDAALLFDSSGGAGVLPASWPAQHPNV